MLELLTFIMDELKFQPIVCADTSLKIILWYGQNKKFCDILLSFPIPCHVERIRRKPTWQSRVRLWWLAKLACQLLGAQTYLVQSACSWQKGINDIDYFVSYTHLLWIIEMYLTVLCSKQSNNDVTWNPLLHNVPHAHNQAYKFGKLFNKS